MNPENWVSLVTLHRKRHWCGLLGLYLWHSSTNFNNFWLELGYGVWAMISLFNRGTVRHVALLLFFIPRSTVLRRNKLEFHDTDMDILARILADTSDTRDWSYSCGKLNDTSTFSRRSSRGCWCRRRGMPAIRRTIALSHFHSRYKLFCEW